MRKINIYLVESPFQLLSAIEAKEYFKDEDSLLILRHVSIHGVNKQADNLLLLYKWDKVIRIKHHSPYIDDLKMLFTIVKLKKLKQEVDKIFVGHPSERSFQWICENVNTNKYFTLDDGAYTIALQRDFFSRGNYLQGNDFLNISKQKNNFQRIRKSIKRNIIKYVFGLKGNNEIKYNVFTCFDINEIPGQIVILHNFNYLKSRASLFKKLQNTVYFFGSPISDDGMVTLDRELNMIKEIKGTYLKMKKTFLYIPHPRDSYEKIISLEKSGIEVKYLSYIAEVDPIVNNVLPSDIASFFSTTLFTLQKIYNYDTITSFRIPEQFINSRAENIKKLYDEYEKSMKVVLLNGN